MRYRTICFGMFVWLALMPARGLYAADPFIHYDDPSPLMSLDMILQEAREAGKEAVIDMENARRHVRDLRKELNKWDKAESLYAQKNYLAALVEYDDWPDSDLEYGYLAEVVEHNLNAAVEFKTSNPEIEAIVAINYHDGKTKYIFVPSELYAYSDFKPNSTGSLILVDADRARTTYQMRTDKEGRPVSFPMEWVNRSPRAGSTTVRISDMVDRVVERLRAVDKHGYENGKMVNTVIRGLRVYEKWLLVRGKSEKEIFNEYRTASLEAPLVKSSYSADKHISTDLLMLADYCVRHPENRPELLSVLVECLLSRVTSRKIDLKTVVKINRWVPIAIEPYELIVQLQQRLSGEKDKKVKQFINFTCGELCRYMAAWHYWQVYQGPEQLKPDDILSLLTPILSEDGFEVDTSVLRGNDPKASSIRTLSAGRLKEVFEKIPAVQQEQEEERQPEGTLAY